MSKIQILAAAFCMALLPSCDDQSSTELIADFETEQTTVMVGDEVVFKDKTIGSPSRWTWFFEGAKEETSVLSQPVARWMKAGNYTVSLNVSNKNSSDEIVKENLITVEWYDSVKADFSFDKVKAFDNETINFTNLSTGYPSNFKWTFTPASGEPIVSEEENPSLTFQPGIYSIKLEVSNPIASDVKELKDAFEILDQYAVMCDFYAMNATTYEGGSVYFENASTGNVQNIQWTFEGGTPSTSSEMNPVVEYSASGIYKVSLKVWNEKYDSEVVKDGYIHVLPTFSSMVLLLPFDNDSKDYGPYGINPSEYSLGDLQPSYEAGHGEGQAFARRFPGGTKGKQYSVLLLPDSDLEAVYPQGSEMTLSVWTKLGEISANNAVFAQGHCPGFEGNQQIWGRFQTGNAFRVTAERTTPKIGNTNTVKDSRFCDGTWHHLVVRSMLVTVDGNLKQDVSVWLDGEKLSSKQTDNVEQYTTPFCIGANLRWTNNAPAPENLYSGVMDDFVLYNKGLTDDQIKSLLTF